MHQRARHHAHRKTMPIVHITLLEGRDDATVKACVKAVARAVHETLNAPLGSIRVVATETRATHWAIGDQTRDELVAVAGEKAK
ncbi:tautomerase family protein [Paraburkholderia sp. D15]|nr:tautomerase family protein [Paraburkholderia sp. D15]WGS54858.1 tautomerase family protein [Paraburkholderia sp. D15]